MVAQRSNGGDDHIVVGHVEARVNAIEVETCAAAEGESCPVPAWAPQIARVCNDDHVSCERSAHLCCCTEPPPTLARARLLHELMQQPCRGFWRFEHHCTKDVIILLHVALPPNDEQQKFHM